MCISFQTCHIDWLKSKFLLEMLYFDRYLFAISLHLCGNTRKYALYQFLRLKQISTKPDMAENINAKVSLSINTIFGVIHISHLSTDTTDMRDTEPLPLPTFQHSGEEIKYAPEREDQVIQSSCHGKKIHQQFQDCQPRKEKCYPLNAITFPGNL